MPVDTPDNDAPAVTISPPSLTLASETHVNTQTNGIQENPAAVGLPNGGYMVVWTLPGNVTKILGQRFDADGNPDGAEIVISTGGFEDSGWPTVAALNDRGFVVSWWWGGGIKATLLGVDGSVLTTPFQVDDPYYTTEIYPVSAGLSDGGFVISWQSYVKDGGGYGIYARRYTVDGSAMGGEFLVHAAHPEHQREPSIAALSDGGFVVAWEFFDTSYAGGAAAGEIQFQRFDAAGNPLGEVIANTFATGRQYKPAVAGLEGGGFVVVWQSAGQDGSGLGIYGQAYDPGGQRLGAEFRVNTTTTGDQGEPSIAALAGGGFVVSWQSYQDGSQQGIYAQEFGADGSRIGGELQANSYTAGDQANSSVAALSNGGFVITWMSQGQEAADAGTLNTGIYAQRFGAAFAATEQVPLDLKGTMTIDDVDAGTGVLTATLSADYGILQISAGDSGAVVDPATNGTGSVSVTGTLAQLNALFGPGGTWTVSYLANDDFPPARAVLTLTANDNGSTGPGGAQAGSATTVITIYAIDDPHTPYDNPGAQFGDSSDNNPFPGTLGDDHLDVSQGGDDWPQGGLGNDIIYYGTEFDTGDENDGGPGPLDGVVLQGNYTITLDALSLVNVEYLSLQSGAVTNFGQSGANSYDYAVTTINANVAAGQQLVVNAQSLQAGEDFTFDGSAETDGTFLIYAGMGVDTLTGGARNDGFYFGEGSFGAGDTLNGGAGTMDQLGLQGDHTITFGAGQLSGIEMIVCLSANDARFNGNAAAPYVYELTMSEGVLGAGGRLYVSANQLIAGECLIFDASAETDGGRYVVYGGEAGDVLTGGAGADEIWGRGGQDWITGGGGADDLYGGASADIFIYLATTDSTAAAMDELFDFATGDAIGLAGIDAVTGGADDTFSFIGSAGFTAAGQLRAVLQSGSRWLVEGDVDGDGLADFALLVTVAGGHAIVATDFVL